MLGFGLTIWDYLTFLSHWRSRCLAVPAGLALATVIATMMKSPFAQQVRASRLRILAWYDQSPIGKLKAGSQNPSKECSRGPRSTQSPNEKHDHPQGANHLRPRMRQQTKTMKNKLKYSAVPLLIAAAAMFVALPASAQQTTGAPGSPSATTTIDGKQLPPPDPKFGGVIKDTRRRLQTVLAADGRAAQGRAQRAPDHDRRPGLRRLAAPLAA